MKVEITKEERDIVITQLGGRLDYFNELIVEEGKKGDVRRVKEIIEAIKPMESFRDKLYNCV